MTMLNAQPRAGVSTALLVNPRILGGRWRSTPRWPTRNVRGRFARSSPGRR